ncbi:TetR/AcrR family transcriptional regulator [Levilactobacillus brevis]|uniref:TetR/AcrR family transcriptional regulator n=1 Tax=Levilactobacillus brevis TaxID=1580 RepID=UPI0039E5B8B0
MDSRVIKTNNSILEAFIKLLKIEPFSKVTVTKICERSMISKSTFYSHYLDKYDLLAKLVHQEVHTIDTVIKKRFQLMSVDNEDVLEISIIQEIVNTVSDDNNIELLLSIHEEQGGDLELELKKSFFEAALKQFNLGKGITSKRSELLAEYYAANAMVSMKWLLSHESNTELMEIVSETQDFYNTLFLS